jgi:hypothetical protein
VSAFSRIYPDNFTLKLFLQERACRKENPMEEKRYCLHCGHQLRGRADKKFCNDSCRSTYNHKDDPSAFPVVRHINKRLLQNRRILAQVLGGADATTITQRELLEKGFSFAHHTHTLSNTNGATSFCCYEMAWQVMHAECCVVHREEVK